MYSPPSPTVHSASPKTDLKVGKGGLPPLSCPRITVYCVVTSPVAGLDSGTCRVFSDLFGDEAGQATLVDFEIEGGACRVLSELLGEAAGASHPS